MSDAPQQTQDFQTMINAAREASMEKAFSKMLSQDPYDISTQAMWPTSQDVDDTMGSEVPSKDLLSLPKCQQAGLTISHARTKGMAPAKCSKHTARQELPTQELSSRGESSSFPTSLSNQSNLEMLSATAQFSVKNVFETILTWKTYKTNKPSPEIYHSKRDIFNIVMTPDRIPKFFIPSLDVDHVFLHVGPSEDVDDLQKEMDITEKKSATPRVKRSRSESHIKTAGMLQGKKTDYSFEDLDKVADHSDPATRAALSLPHLPKITTPYGFLALGEIPNIRRKESLFFNKSSIGAQTLFLEKEKNIFSRKNCPDQQMKQQSLKECSRKSRKPNRSVSWEGICQDSDTAHSTLPSSSNTNKCPTKCEKTRFQVLMKKHLSGIKCMKLNNGIKVKIPAKLGRTQSSPIA
ncbi:Hypothetical predicted protein [Pelobates cultripes]|uniref:Uncharacterized protein n=1 Tax=Pelobates cultripes TaxID=61616 RepID=A0AAD1SDX9_PELCU|nr:Hypothetical predicted protein [Pelobates cultripes]